MIETERLRLRPWTAPDAAFHRELWTERDPRVPPHRRIDSEGEPSIATLEEGIRRSPQEGPIRLLVAELRETGEPIGYCGLIAGSDATEGEPEIAYELLRRHQGRGYATEAASAIVDLARTAGIPRLWASVWAWNSASLRVLAKLGFTEVGRTETERGANVMTMREL